MHPLSDKDLDRLSQEAAEQYDVDQNTSGWEKLEQKLNKYLPETGKKERRRFLLFIWLLALLFGGGLLWMLTGPGAPELAASKPRSSETKLPVSQKTNKGQLPRADKNKPAYSKTYNPEQKAIDLVTSTPNDKQSGKEKTNTVVQEKMIRRDNPAFKTRKSKLRQKNSWGNNIVPTNNSRGKNVKKKNETLIVVNPSFVRPSAQPFDKKEDQRIEPPGNKKAEDILFPTSDIPSPASQNTTKVSADSARQTLPDQTDTNSVLIAIPKKVAASKNKGSFQKGVEIGLVVAPDMSNVKFSNSDKVGFNVGIQLGYRLSQRWSINSGIFYTRKNYTSRGKDFHPPKGLWFDNIQLDKVKGSCFMFDIPLNVRYDLNNSTNHRFFVNTGLSTYLMKKENYHYYYRYTNGNPGYRYRSYPSQKQYWISILNISAGFEKRLNKHFALQAEPYLKVPLKGVGFGNLQLNSYGMYFSLKYKPGLRTGKK